MDDPEKRTADLEKPVAAPNAGARTTPAPLGASTWFGVAIVLVWFGVPALYWLCANAPSSYAYWSGTPTVATIEQCDADAKAESCSGSWAVGGVPQTGPIDGVYGKDRQVGSQLQVRVHDGTAHGPAGVTQSYVAGFCACYLVVFATVVAWFVWRRRKTGRWPLAGLAGRRFGGA